MARLFFVGDDDDDDGDDVVDDDAEGEPDHDTGCEQEIHSTLAIGMFNRMVT